MHAMLKRFDNRENGFTLVELLIVVLIIGILAAVAIPVYIGIQNQAHKAAIKADTNQAVKQVQVAMTEGGTATAQYGSKNGGDKGSTVTVKASTTTGASANDFMVVTSETTTGGAINYTYTYDSVTGQFSDSDTNVALGGGSQPDPNTVVPVINTTILPELIDSAASPVTVPIDVNGTPTLTWTGLPSCVTAIGTTLRYQANCVPQTFSRVTPTLTATNSAGSSSRSFYLIEKYASSTYLFNYDFNTTGASDFSATTGASNIALGTAPDGRQSMVVTPGAASVKITTNTGTIAPASGSYTYQYGSYVYLPTGASLQMCFMHSGNEYCNPAITTANTWMQVSGGLGGSAANVQIGVRYIINNASGKPVYIDDFRAVKL